MSDMRLLEVGHELTVQFGNVASSTTKRLSQEVRRIKDLTNDEVFWSRAGAIMIGAGSIAGGAAGVASPFVPNGAALAGMTADTIRTILKTVGKSLPKVTEAGQMIVQGESSRAQSARSLAQSCEVQALQQKQGDSFGKISSIAQAIQAVLSAKSRSE